MTDFKRREEIDEKAEDLQEAAGYSRDECGEWWSALAALVPRYRDGASEKFAAAIESEIDLEHARFKSEFTFVETKRKVTSISRRLVHESEL